MREFVKVMLDRRTIFARARVARSPWARLVGLLWRSGLDPEEALIFPHCRSIHTFLMRFPIDVAFLGPAGDVVKMHGRVGRGRVLFGGAEAKSVMECASGRLSVLGVKPGARLSWA